LAGNSIAAVHFIGMDSDVVQCGAKSVFSCCHLPC